ncbi:MAG: cell division/cell wall cluster transcriptional repressor MraZ [Actinobacteria bacterium]|nr:cell division/cell wall cluster transcriptional repressor MraZ [Actinomycetota bacterium]MTA88182.1 cell division/cell wall cluster transcriptional repressor MraZ [Actinomycetota bacterium]
MERIAGMFVGTFEHSLDDKGRVVLPATFRAQLVDKGFISQLDRCLGLWTEEGFGEMATRLQDKVRSGETSQESLRAFAANAHEVRPDSQGRITIPQRLRDFASLDKEAVVIGAFGRIEIWNAGRWNDQASLADDSLTQAVTSLGL